MDGRSVGVDGGEGGVMSVVSRAGGVKDKSRESAY